MKKIEVNDKKERKILIITLTVIVIITIIIVLSRIMIKNKVTKDIVTVEENNNEEIEWLDDETEENINIDNIISQNSNGQMKDVMESQIAELEYETQYINNNKLPKGLMQVLQQGKDGQQELIIKKQYLGDELISDKQVGRKIIEVPIQRIVEIGTSKKVSNHKIKQGDTVYSTPYEAHIKKEANKESKTIATIKQNTKLKISKKRGNWYYVKYNTNSGWIESDCVTYLNSENIIYNNDAKKYSGNTVKYGLNKNMALNKPSGLTLEQFEKVLKNESKDKNHVFEENAKYFYYAEQEYSINGIFVAAIAIHESNWGTSKIATNKRNLFGYGAYDMSAYSSAYSYENYSMGIDMISRVLAKHYLNRKGTSIYDGEIATGKYYNGNNLAAVNKKYATDKKWSDNVYKWMKYLYERL